MKTILTLSFLASLQLVLSGPDGDRIDLYRRGYKKLKTSKTKFALEGGEDLEQEQTFNPYTRELSVSVPAHGDREAVTVIYGEKDMVTAHDTYCLVGKPPKDLDKSFYENENKQIETPLNHNDVKSEKFIFNLIDQNEMTDNEKESLPESFKTLCKNKALRRTSQVTVNKTMFEENKPFLLDSLITGEKVYSRKKRGAQTKTICLRIGKCCDFTFKTLVGTEAKYIPQHTNQVTIICTACSPGDSLCDCDKITDQQSFDDCSFKSGTCKVIAKNDGWECGGRCISIEKKCVGKCWQNIPSCPPGGNKECCPKDIQEDPNCNYEDCRTTTTTSTKTTATTWLQTSNKASHPPPPPSDQLGCTTKNGKPCIFPFEYKDVRYDKCTSVDGFRDQHWCATSTDADWVDAGKSGLCDPDSCNLGL